MSKRSHVQPKPCPSKRTHMHVDEIKTRIDFLKTLGDDIILILIIYLRVDIISLIVLKVEMMI